MIDDKKFVEFTNKVIEERIRQNKLHPDWIRINEMALSVLAEEFGEVAKAINEGDHENLKEELVQLASVCLRWYEGLK